MEITLPALLHGLLFVGGIVIGAIWAALTTIFQIIMQRVLRVVTVVAGLATAGYLIYRGSFILTDQFVLDLGFTATSLIGLVRSFRAVPVPR